MALCRKDTNKGLFVCGQAETWIISDFPKGSKHREGNEEREGEEGQAEDMRQEVRGEEGEAERALQELVEN